MKRILWAATVTLLLAAAAKPAYERWKTGALMTEAARNFLASLTPEQRAKAMLPFDDANRKDWHFIPRARKGIPLKELRPEQQQLAHAFLSSGLSRRAYIQAVTIMSLDQVLLEIERGSGPLRDPSLYYVTVFGEPTPLGRWGWRVEGHHLSVNFVVDKGEVRASTPAMFGANPAEVRQGTRAGLRTLAEEEDLARKLIQSFDARLREKATIAAQAPREVIADPTKRAKDIGAPAGVPYSSLTPAQRQMLEALLDLYITRSPEDVAAQRWKEIKDAGLAKVHFAWAGGALPNQGHYYRIQGPTFLVEYDDTQNDANHIHSVWRDMRGDFGPDLLAQHHRLFPHPAPPDGRARTAD
jgi:hypothetical protein